MLRIATGGRSVRFHLGWRLRESSCGCAALTNFRPRQRKWGNRLRKSIRATRVVMAQSVVWSTRQDVQFCIGSRNCSDRVAKPRCLNNLFLDWCYSWGIVTARGNPTIDVFFPTAPPPTSPSFPPHHRFPKRLESPLAAAFYLGIGFDVVEARAQKRRPHDREATRERALQQPSEPVRETDAARRHQTDCR